MSAKKRKMKKSGGGGFVFGSVSFIVICAALVFGMSVFFRISDIEVSGAEKYSSAEIVEASGLKEGDSLMMLNRTAVADKIRRKLVYIGEIKISRKLPSMVTIEVMESGTVATIETDEGAWIIDSQCRLLEPCKPEDAAKYVKVSGFQATVPVAGDKPTIPEDDKAKLEYLQNILTAMNSQKLLSDVSAIDVSNSGNAQFEYLKRFKVMLGRLENTEHKLGLLVNAVAKLDPIDTGIMDLSKNKQAHFSPY